MDPHLWSTIAKSAAWRPYLVWQEGETNWQEYIQHHASSEQLPTDRSAGSDDLVPYRSWTKTKLPRPLECLFQSSKDTLTGNRWRTLSMEERI